MYGFCGDVLSLGVNGAVRNNVTMFNINYPNDNYIYAYYVKSVSERWEQPQSLVSSPLQLTVGYDTSLELTIIRDFDSTRHVFNCRLQDASSCLGVNGRTVKLKLNQTEYGNTTDANGLAQFVLWLSPQQNNNQTCLHNHPIQQLQTHH